MCEIRSLYVDVYLRKVALKPITEYPLHVINIYWYNIILTFKSRLTVTFERRACKPRVHENEDCKNPKIQVINIVVLTSL